MTAMRTWPYTELRKTIWDRDSGMCGLCSLPVGLEEFHPDHIIPKSKGGPFTAENLRPAHPLCNRRRGARDQMPEQGKRYVSKGKKILLDLDEQQLAWLDDFRFGQRFESRSEAIRWLLDWAKTENPDRARRSGTQVPAGPASKEMTP